MKKEEIPQDESALKNFTKEVTYVVNDDGTYTTGKSTGWRVKAEALDIAWDDVNKKIQLAKEKIEKGEASPILYFMESKIMDIGILAAYTGFWKWTVKRHLNPKVFKNLSEKKLQKYADLFEISLQELKHPSL